MAQTILTEAAPPEKEALYGALGIYPDKNSALAELIDNSGEYGNTTTIKIVCEPNRIIISDDGAGLNPETMVSMFRIKRNEHAAGETGKFGYGFKSATNYLGKNTTVLSLQDENFVWGKAEPNDEWQYEIKPIPHGDQEYERYQAIWNDYRACNSKTGTIIFIPVLNEELDAHEVSSLVDFCSRTFSCNFPQKKISININGDVVTYKRPFGEKKAETHFFKKAVFNNKSPISIEVLALEPAQEQEFNKLVIVRNNRLIASGVDLRIPILSNVFIQDMQVVLRCDDTLDTLLGMSAMKTIGPRQRMNRALQNFIMREMGLEKHLQKIAASRSEEAPNEVEVDLTKHLNFMVKKNEMLEKLPRAFLNKLTARAEDIKQKKSQPHQPQIADFSSPNFSSAPTVPPQSPEKPTTIVKTNSTQNTKSLFNIDLQPLGVFGKNWQLEEREIGESLQLVIVFNWDKEFIRNTITNYRDTSAQDYINEAIAEVVCFYAELVDQESQTGYNKVQRRIAIQKQKLFGG